MLILTLEVVTMTKIVLMALPFVFSSCPCASLEVIPLYLFSVTEDCYTVQSNLH